MTDHWQVIEDALNGERCTIVNMMDGWRNTSATYKRYVPELEAIDAALAFVREQRTQLAGLTPDVSEIRNASPAPSLYA